MKYGKRSTIIIVLVCVLVVAIVSAAVATYALWTEQQGNTKFIAITVSDENISLKYQIFVPIDENGNRIPGSFDTEDGGDFSNANYTIDAASGKTLSDVAGFALIGWTGGTAVTKLELPSEAVTRTVNDTEQTKTVQKIMTDIDFAEYKFVGNEIITEIIISEAVVHIAGGVFQYMPKLTTITFRGDAETAALTIEDYAFANCTSRIPTAPPARPIVGDPAKYY